jgi:hypothetical protein
MTTHEIRHFQKQGSFDKPTAVSSSSSLDSFGTGPIYRVDLTTNAMQADMSENQIDKREISQKEQSVTSQPSPSHVATSSEQSEVRCFSLQTARDVSFDTISTGPENLLTSQQPTVDLPKPGQQPTSEIVTGLKCNTLPTSSQSSWVRVGYPGTFTTSRPPRVDNIPLFQMDSLGNMVSSVAAGTNSVPEFLYQLTKMLTDDNRDIIEWTNGTSTGIKTHEVQLCIHYSAVVVSLLRSLVT